MSEKPKIVIPTSPMAPRKRRLIGDLEEDRKLGQAVIAASLVTIEAVPVVPLVAGLGHLRETAVGLQRMTANGSWYLFPDKAQCSKCHAREALRIHKLTDPPGVTGDAYAHYKCIACGVFELYPLHAVGTLLTKQLPTQLEGPTAAIDEPDTVKQFTEAQAWRVLGDSRTYMNDPEWKDISREVREYHLRKLQQFGCDCKMNGFCNCRAYCHCRLRGKCHVVWGTGEDVLEIGKWKEVCGLCPACRVVTDLTYNGLSLADIAMPIYRCKGCWYTSLIAP